ncbi:MAG TPA: CpsB/CapC family capsule biosynthesis tyrosine phosphatase [Xanthomonadales bacterium]|nr:CpsB/CapC family capsule biosynthesis tyrosine phosphatase [Xanthomonadales bacterium]
MYDLHCHLLPAIDDGAQTEGEALALARAAVANGITHAVCTPHFHPGRFESSVADTHSRLTAFRAALARESIPLHVGVAGEVRAGPEAMVWAETGELPVLGRWNGLRVVLLEFPHGSLPPGSDKLVAWLMRNGVQPLIAHPERNKDVIRRLDALSPLIAEGALLQVTADAVSGGFGPFAQQRAQELLERGWVTILASDAHNLEHRPPVLERGRAAAAEIVGEAESWRLVRDRPALLAAQHFA